MPEVNEQMADAPNNSAPFYETAFTKIKIAASNMGAKYREAVLWTAKMKLGTYINEKMVTFMIKLMPASMSKHMESNVVKSAMLFANANALAITVELIRPKLKPEDQRFADIAVSTALTAGASAVADGINIEKIVETFLGGDVVASIKSIIQAEKGEIGEVYVPDIIVKEEEVANEKSS